MKVTQPRDLIVAGIMTGNSVDAVDVATFRASVAEDQVSGFKQLSFHSSPCSPNLREMVFNLKALLKDSRGVITQPIDELLGDASELYHREVNEALKGARLALRSDCTVEIDLIGFHGQTLGHAPPSVATGDQKPYTIQLVNGGAIADAQDVVTVSDFRSDDLLNGGEGAPFAPGFNALLTPALGVERAVFINAGNTSNIALINSATNDVRGWDCGPCNQFTDLLMREEKGLAVDEDGLIAQKGVVIKELLQKLWESAVNKEDGSNALEIRGPRSFDPQWYRLPAELRAKSEPFENRIRTVVAFSAYCVTHSLAMAIHDGYVPEAVLLFGGGWKNPVLMEELYSLCDGSADYILPEHRDLFSDLQKKIIQPANLIRSSDQAGLPSDGMEAGIFAFAAVQRILEKPFTQPSFTNCKSATICGAILVPESGKIAHVLGDLELRDERSLFHDVRLSRAAPDNQKL